MRLSLRTLLLGPTLLLITLVLESESLQCFNCRGISDFDPQKCFEPTVGQTTIQECREDETCEKKITQLDRLQTVIERGCSSNCDGRIFIWNEDFQVYCCDGNRCNRSSGLHSSILIVIFTPVAAWLFLR